MVYNAVIFDLFGTLVDQSTLPGPLGSEFRRTMAAVAAALSVDQRDFLRLWYETVYERDSGVFPTMEAYLQHLCRECGSWVEAGQIAHAVELRLEYLRGALMPRIDAIETLTTLKASGHKIGLVSDCSVEVSILWPETPLSFLMDVAILSCEVGMTKPDPRIYQMVCERLQVSPTKCLYVGMGAARN